MQKITLKSERYFAVAPLIPCGMHGDTQGEILEGHYKVGQYGDGFLTLAEALPLGVEFYVGGDKSAPDWAQQAFDDLSDMKGAMSGIAVYRRLPEGEVTCAAFLEVIHGQAVLPEEQGVAFQPERYVPDSPFAHDKDVRFVTDFVLVNDEEDRIVHGMTGPSLKS